MERSGKKNFPNDTRKIKKNEKINNQKKLFFSALAFWMNFDYNLSK